MAKPSIIAIDGPAASGKSTLGERLADYLGYLYFDTGNMYRAVTWAAIKMFGRVNVDEEVSSLAEKVMIDIQPSKVDDGRSVNVLLDGEDITWEIRRPEVDANVSEVSAYKRVRAAMTAQQRRIGMRGGVVMVGRDIGTVVFPEAELKIYLVASVEERAKRRFNEVTSRGEHTDFECILDALRKRDAYDAGRKLSPMKPAEDAVILDTDKLSIDEVVDKVIHLIED